MVPLEARCDVLPPATCSTGRVKSTVSKSNSQRCGGTSPMARTEWLFISPPAEGALRSQRPWWSRCFRGSPEP